MLYLAGSDRRVTAVDLTTGVPRWRTTLGSGVVGGLVQSHDTLYAATTHPDGQVYAVSADNGKHLWTRRIGPVTVPLARIGSQLVALTESGAAVALNAALGQVRWRRRVGSARAPAAGERDGKILVSTLDSLFRLDPDSGEVLVRRRAPGAVLGGWIITDSLLVSATADGSVVAIDPVTLATVWRAPLDGPVFSRPTLSDDTLYVVTRVGTVYRLPLAGTRAPRPEVVATLDWAATTAPVIGHGLIFVGGSDGTIRALRPDGTQLWRLAVWAPVTVPPIVLPDGVAAVGGNGDLHRFEP